MDRLTGSGAKSLKEAYSKVYAQPEVEMLNEQAKETKTGYRYTDLPGGGTRREFQTALKGGMRVKWVIDDNGKGSWVPDKPEFKPNLQYVGLTGVETKRIDPNKDDSGRPLPKSEPVKEPVKQPVVKKDPNVTAGGTKFERRLPTMAELKAAQAARAAALKAGKTKPEAEESAVKAGVLKGTTSTAGSNLSGKGAITPPNGGKSPTGTGSVQGSSLRQEIDAVRNKIQTQINTGQFRPVFQKQDVDLFDILKGEFLEEGYSEEDTMYMMANLNEEQLQEFWRSLGAAALKQANKIPGVKSVVNKVGRLFGRTPAPTRIGSGDIAALRLHQNKAHHSLQRLNQQSTRLNASDARRTAAAADPTRSRLGNDPRLISDRNAREAAAQVRARNKELGRPEWAGPQPVDSLNYKPGDPQFTRSLRQYYADKRAGVKGLD